MQRESANGRSSVTTKEQILIREIKNVGTDRAGADEGYGLYDVNAYYEPIFDKSYLAECLELYKKYFPESGIAMIICARLPRARVHLQNSNQRLCLKRKTRHLIQKL